jgi:hypothetical protein
MEHIQKVVELINSQLQELESGMSGRKSDIEKAHKEAIQIADATRKEAVAIADRSKKEALKQFDAEEKQIQVLQNTLKSLGGTSKPEKKGKAGKALEVPKEYNEKLPVNQKIAYALAEIGRGDKEEIAEFIGNLDGKESTEVAKKLSGILSQMKTKGHLTTEKQGRKDIYTLS